MKNVLLSALLLVTLCSFGETPLLLENQNHAAAMQRQLAYQQLAQSNFNMALADANVKCGRYQKMRKTGLVLLCVGAPVCATGIAGMAAGSVLAYNGEYAGVPLMAVGAVFFVGGLGMTGAGVPLYIIGKVKSQKYCGGTSFELQQNKNGLGLAYKF
ncbi:MAG: hypothetical protein U0T73_10685 [Chitinophagales bacterium]